MSPSIASGYHVAVNAYVKNFLKVDGVACTLTKPFTAQSEVIGGGMTIALAFHPTGNGMAGTVDVTATMADANFEMKGSTNYTLEQIGGAITTGNTSTIAPGTTVLADAPDGSFHISYGEITFSINQPGAPKPQLPAAGWGPPLLVPGAANC